MRALLCRCQTGGVSAVGALWLFLVGWFGLALAWNAARPIIDPTRRYSPLWLPAMVVAELSPLLLVAHAVALAIGVALGGLDRTVGVLGAVLVAMAVLLLGWVRVRTLLGARRLRARVDGVVHPARGAARWRGRPVPTPDGVIERLGIEWASGLTLDLTRPDDERCDLPVCVYVHGGGWRGGDPQRQARDLYHALALAGWASVAIRYPFTPHVSVERQIDVVRDAIVWARTGLGEYGIAATDVVIAGGSAGGHLAAMAALTPRHEGERVAACIGMYGIYDMANRHRTRAPWTMIRTTVMGATVAERPDRYRSVSPIDQDPSDSPPFLLVHGTHDTLVPIGEAELFHRVLSDAGRPVELIPVHGAQHAFDGLSGITSRTTAAAIRDWLRPFAGR